MLEGILDEATLGLLLDASHWPNTLTLIAQQRLDAALSAARATDRAVLAVMFGEEILDSIRAVAVALGGCERIMGTPLPFVYVSHLRTFLVLVLCFGVPLVFACSWGWAAIGLASVVCGGFMIKYFGGHTEVTWSKSLRATYDHQGLSESREKSHNSHFGCRDLNKKTFSIFPFKFISMGDIAKRHGVEFAKEE